MELAKTMREARVLRVMGMAAAALWLGSAAMLTLPRTVHAQDDSGIGNGSTASDDNADVNDDDTDFEAINPDVAPADINGSWTGTALDKKHGQGPLTMTFSQPEGSRFPNVSAWVVTFGDNTGAGGTGGGKLNGKSLKLVLLDPEASPKCRIKISAKVIVEDGVAEEIKGTYTQKKCVVRNSGGKIDLTPTP
ncbi:MAG: hypothetical protein ABSG46_14570 [Candidatus Binataceae bacterium]|jgi:hypothetical protein